MIVDETVNADESCTRKDIEKCLSGTNPEKNNTTNKEPPAQNACFAFGVLWILLSVLFFVVSWIVSKTSPNPRTPGLFVTSIIVMFDCMIARLIITVPNHDKPNESKPWGWRVFFLFLYHHLSTLGLLAFGALLQRSWNIL